MHSARADTGGSGGMCRLTNQRAAFTERGGRGASIVEHDHCAQPAAGRAGQQEVEEQEEAGGEGEHHRRRLRLHSAVRWEYTSEGGG